MDPRAFALPREIGVTDLRASVGSVGVDETAFLRPHARQRAAAIARGQLAVNDVERHGLILAFSVNACRRYWRGANITRARLFVQALF